MTTDPAPQGRLRLLPLYEAEGARFTDPDSGQRWYNTPSGPVAGVTSILSGSKDTRGLDLWRESVGEARADEIRDFAAWRGKRLHSNVENFLNTREEPPFHFVDDAYWKSIRPFLSLVTSPPLLQEGMLWHPDGYAGTCDAIAYLQDRPFPRLPSWLAWDRPTLLDWKTADKQPDARKLYDYTLQVAAYVTAANHVYAKHALLIEQAAIACAVRGQTASITWLDAKALKQLYRHFLARKMRYTHARPSKRRN